MAQDLSDGLSRAEAAGGVERRVEAAPAEGGEQLRGKLGLH